MKKRALLFGNDNYTKGNLKNAANDACSLAAKLMDLGFECSCYTNVSEQLMEEMLCEFASTLTESDVGLFFYAGHGIQCKGKNYLAATDTNFMDESSCKYSAIPLDLVIEKFEDSKVNVKIIILDACRDNPFTNAWRGISNEGLAPVYAPKGTIIAFATSPGQKASDLGEKNGVYTNALLTHIGTKRITVEDMFKRVRNSVSSITSNQQISWEHTSLMGNFYFNSGYADGKFSAAYSQNAIADNDYTFDTNSIVGNIVIDLKSHNWYTQNPAISKISGSVTSETEIDEIFILGRNIYQAACGTASNAINWIEKLEKNLDSFSEYLAFHLLNGILFEIYFDRNGKMRDYFKTGYYEIPLNLCFSNKYINSSIFIRKYLEQFSQRIIYLPGSDEIMYVNINAKQSQENDGIILDMIFINGLICFDINKANTSDHYQMSSMYWSRIGIEEFENLLKKKIVIPKQKLNIVYNFSLSENSSIQCPYNFVLNKYE